MQLTTLISINIQMYLQRSVQLTDGCKNSDPIFRSVAPSSEQIFTFCSLFCHLLVFEHTLRVYFVYGQSFLHSSFKELPPVEPRGIMQYLESKLFTRFVELISVKTLLLLKVKVGTFALRFSRMRTGNCLQFAKQTPAV